MVSKKVTRRHIDSAREKSKTLTPPAIGRTTKNRCVFVGESAAPSATLEENMNRKPKNTPRRRVTRDDDIIIIIIKYTREIGKVRRSAAMRSLIYIIPKYIIFCSIVNAVPLGVVIYLLYLDGWHISFFIFCVTE